MGASKRQSPGAPTAKWAAPRARAGSQVARALFIVSKDEATRGRSPSALACHRLQQQRAQDGRAEA